MLQYTIISGTMTCLGIVSYAATGDVTLVIALGAGSGFGFVCHRLWAIQTTVTAVKDTASGIRDDFKSELRSGFKELSREIGADMKEISRTMMEVQRQQAVSDAKHDSVHDLKEFFRDKEGSPAVSVEIDNSKGTTDIDEFSGEFVNRDQHKGNKSGRRKRPDV